MLREVLEERGSATLNAMKVTFIPCCSFLSGVPMSVLYVLIYHACIYTNHQAGCPIERSHKKSSVSINPKSVSRRAI